MSETNIAPQQNQEQSLAQGIDGMVEDLRGKYEQAFRLREQLETLQDEISGVEKTIQGIRVGRQLQVELQERDAFEKAAQAKAEAEAEAEAKTEPKALAEGGKDQKEPAKRVARTPADDAAAA